MKKAITIKEIKVDPYGTIIPIGTEFKIVKEVKNFSFSVCTGLPITSIWNDEWEYMETI